MAAKQADDLLRLAKPQQAVVDKDAGQTIADRLMDQQRGDRRIDPPERPHKTRPPPTWARIAATASARNAPIVQSALSPAIL